MNLSLPHLQKGFTIAELMVSVAIGLIITLSIGSLFMSSQRDYKQNDATSRMQENARFALDLLTTDLRFAGFLAPIASPADIDVESMTIGAPAVDCGPATASGKAGLYNFTQMRYVMNFGNQISKGNIAAFYDTCLDEKEVKDKSSILIIKRADGAATPPLQRDDPTTPAIDETTVDYRKEKTPYVFANGANAQFYTHTSTIPPLITNGEHWEYQPRIYYIMDEDTNGNNQLDGGEDVNGNGRLDKDVLYRKMLSNLDFVSEPLAEGIEAFHIEYGIDTISNAVYDGAPGFFHTPAVDTDPWGDTTVEFAVSATIYVLARTTEADPETGYRDNKSYQLGLTGPIINAPNDRFHRRVYSTTIALKNIRNQVMAK